MFNRQVLHTFAVLLALGSHTAVAQNVPAADPSAPRFSVGIYSTNAAVTPGIDRTMELGGGFGIAVGYAFSPRFEVHSLTGSAYMAWDDYFLTNLDLEGRYLLGRRTGRWVPHLALGASGRTPHYGDSHDQDLGLWDRSTIALTVGGGISYHLNRSVALDWSLRHAFGNMVRSSCAVATDAESSCATTTRVSFGISWFPFSR